MSGSSVSDLSMSTLTEVGEGAYVMGDAEIDGLVGPDLNGALGVDSAVDMFAEDYMDVALDQPKTVKGKSLKERVSKLKKGVFTLKNVLKVAAIAGLVLVGGTVVLAVVLGLLAVLPFVWVIPIVLMSGGSVGAFLSSLTLGMYVCMQIFTLVPLILVVGIFSGAVGSSGGSGFGNVVIGGALNMAGAR